MKIERIQGNLGVTEEVPGGWRVVEIVTDDGHYITWPMLYNTKGKALEEIRRFLLPDGLDRDADRLGEPESLGQVRQCLVIGKDPCDEQWYLLTRRVFRGREAAEAYAKTMSVPTIVVEAVRPISWNIAS